MTKFTKGFIKQLNGFDKSIKEELYKAVEKVVENPQCSKPLRNRLGGCFEERVRKYRILYIIKNGEPVFFYIHDKEDTFKDKSIFNALRKVASEFKFQFSGVYDLFKINKISFSNEFYS